MIKLEPQVVRCLGLLRSPELAPLMEYLKATRQHTLEQMAQAQTQDQILRMQGEARFLKEFIELVAKSPELMAKMRG